MRSKRVFLRSCYQRALSQIFPVNVVSEVNVLSRWFVISGNSGIGKSISGILYLQYALQNGYEVAFYNTNINPQWFYFFSAKSVCQPDFATVVDYLSDDKKRTAVIFDTPNKGVVDENNFLMFPASLVIVICSPKARNSDRIRGILKQMTTNARIVNLYFPVFSLEEAKQCRLVCYPNIKEESVITRFKKFGGIARTLFSPETDIQLDDSLTEAIEMCDIKCLTDSGIDGLLKMDKSSSWILHYRVDEGQLQRESLAFASEHVANLAMDYYLKHKHNAVVDFLQSSIVYKPSLGVIRGKTFEKYAFSIIKNGGDFICYSLNWTTGMRGNSKIYCIVRGECFIHKIEASNRIVLLERKNAENPKLEEYDIGALCDPNFETVDALKQPHTAYQITTSSSHDVVNAGLDYLLKYFNCDKERKLRIIFVVADQTVFDEFTFGKFENREEYLHLVEFFVCWLKPKKIRKVKRTKSASNQLVPTISNTHAVKSSGI